MLSANKRSSSIQYRFVKLAKGSVTSRFQLTIGLIRPMALSNSNAARNPHQPGFGVNFIDLTNTLTWYRENGLLPSSMACVKCGRNMKEYVKNQLSDGKVFQCNYCQSYQQSIRQGTLFHKSKLPLQNLAYLVFYFSLDVPAYIASRLLGPAVDYKSIINWYYRMREICSKRLISSTLVFDGNEVALMCGEGTVEVDESLFGKKPKVAVAHLAKNIPFLGL